MNPKSSTIPDFSHLLIIPVAAQGVADAKNPSMIGTCIDYPDGGTAPK